MTTKSDSNNSSTQSSTYISKKQPCVDYIVEYFSMLPNTWPALKSMWTQVQSWGGSLEADFSYVDSRGVSRGGLISVKDLERAVRQNKGNQALYDYCVAVASSHPKCSEKKYLKSLESARADKPAQTSKVKETIPAPKPGSKVKTPAKTQTPPAKTQTPPPLGKKTPPAKKTPAKKPTQGQRIDALEGDIGDIKAMLAAILAAQKK